MTTTTEIRTEPATIVARRSMTAARAVIWAGAAFAIIFTAIMAGTSWHEARSETIARGVGIAVLGIALLCLLISLISRLRPAKTGETFTDPADQPMGEV